MEISLKKEIELFASVLQLEERELFQMLMEISFPGALCIYLRSRGFSWRQVGESFEVSPAVAKNITEKTIAELRLKNFLEDHRTRIFDS